jgi:hypothetical protein
VNIHSLFRRQSAEKSEARTAAKLTARAYLFPPRAASQAKAMPDYIYVSYAAKDSIAAEAIVEVLENKGFHCWLARRDLLHESFATDALARVIVDAKALVLLFSDWANKSKFIEREVAIAVDENLPVLVLTEDDDLELNPLLRVLLSRARWVRVRTLTRIDAALTELLLPPAAEPPQTVPTRESSETIEILFVSNRVPESRSRVCTQ